MTLFILQAQPAIEWQKSFGGSDWDEAQCIQPTPDGGYIVAGYSSSADGDVNGHLASQDCWIVKLNNTGNIEWEKSFGGIGVQMAYSIKLTKEGGYVVAGKSDITNSDFWIIKLSGAGDLQWEKKLGSSGDESAQCIQQTDDGGYIVVGYSGGFNNGDVSGSHGGYDGWIVKLDDTGILQWQKCLGGSSGDAFSSVQQTKDGGFIIAGQTSSSDGNVSGNHGGNDYWIVKLTNAGNLEWQKCLGSQFEDRAYDIEVTKDGGFVVAGHSTNNTGNVSVNKGGTDQWIVKLSWTGIIQWEKSFGGSSDDFAFDIQPTPSGDYVVAGWSGSSDGDLSFHHGSVFFDDYWVTKLGGSGNLLWQKSMGGTGEDKANSIALANDGGYVVAGYNGTNDGEVTGNHGGHDFWVIKLSAEPCTPKISIKASALTICSGSSVTFKADFAYGGSNPVFQWMKNGINVGTNSDTYIDHNLVNGDIITCILTSNAACVSSTNETSNPIIINVNSGQPVITSFAGTGFLGYSGDGGPATSARIFYPGGICFDDAGNLFFADRGNHCIRKIDKVTGTIATIAGTGRTGYSGDGGSALLADIAGPTGLFIDPAGDIYIAASLSNCIRKVSVKTGIITTVAGRNLGGYNGDGVPAQNATLDQPSSICMDAAGNLYIADTENKRIRKISAATGIITTIAGNGYAGSAGDGGPAVNAEVFPYGIRFDGKECLYIADGGNHRIRKINLTTGIITTVAGNGNPGFAGDGGLATYAQLKYPTDICFDSIGNLYISDRGNDRIRKVDFNTGIIHTVAGSGLLSPLGDGGGAINASLLNPWGISIDGDGDLYIADANHDLIRKITGLTLDIPSDLPTLSALADSICKGTATSLTIISGKLNGASDWYWYKDSCGGVPEGIGNSIIVKPTSTTTYFVRGEGNCVTPGFCASISITVNDPVTPSVQITADPAGSVCPGTPISFTAIPVNGGEDPIYQWFKNGAIVANNEEVYTSNTFNNGDVIYCNMISNATCLTQTNATSNSIAIAFESIPSGAISPVNSTVCAGSHQQLTIDGGVSYQWMFNDVPIPGATGNTYKAWEQGVYSVVIDNGKCRGSASNTSSLTVHPLPVGSIYPDAGAICKSESILLTTAEGYEYQWLLNNSEILGATSNSYVATEPGNYSVVLSHNSCSVKAGNDAVISTGVAQKGKRDIIRVAKNMPFSLQARNIGQNYLWSPIINLDNPAISNPVITASQDRVYTVTISSPTECPVTDTVEVQVFSKPNVYVPTGFSPDGNGLNDFLMPITVHIKEINYFKVFNRSGKMIFQTKKIGEGWDGYYQGKLQPSDVYVWIFEAKNTDGKLIREKGTSTLIR